MSFARGDIWVFDLSHGGLETRITSDQAEHHFPTWAPTQEKIAFASLRDGVWGIYVRDLGSDKDELVHLSDWKRLRVTDWSSDGRYLLFSASVKGGVGGEEDDIYALDLQGERKPVALVQSKGFDGFGTFSPDGKWIAYVSDESGRPEIYIRPFLRPGGKVRVSPGGGLTPRWRRDGREIIYRSLSETEVLAVEVKSGDAALALGAPTKLFESPPGPAVGADFDVTPEGGRLLVTRGVGQKPRAPATVVVNWTAEVKQKSAEGNTRK